MSVLIKGLLAAAGRHVQNPNDYDSPGCMGCLLPLLLVVASYVGTFYYLDMNGFGEMAYLLTAFFGFVPFLGVCLCFFIVMKIFS